MVIDQEGDQLRSARRLRARSAWAWQTVLAHLCGPGQFLASRQLNLVIESLATPALDLGMVPLLCLLLQVALVSQRAKHDKMFVVCYLSVTHNIFTEKED